MRYRFLKFNTKSSTNTEFRNAHGPKMSSLFIKPVKRVSLFPLLNMQRNFSVLEGESDGTLPWARPTVDEDVC